MDRALDRSKAKWRIEPEDRIKLAGKLVEAFVYAESRGSSGECSRTAIRLIERQNPCRSEVCVKRGDVEEHCCRWVTKKLIYHANRQIIVENPNSAAHQRLVVTSW